MSERVIVVVSGLPRSGTSMVMRMLEAGGIEPLCDGVRAPDEDNPLGYYEFERVKGLPADTGWLELAEGRAVKVISALLDHLPADRRYDVVFVEREVGEVLASQRRMLARRGRSADPAGDERMAVLFAKHVAALRERVAARPEMRLEVLRYDQVVAEPHAAARRLALFLRRRLDEGAAAARVDPALYRSRVRRGA